MTESTVKLNTLKIGDRFRLPNDSRVFYKAYYSCYYGSWVCLLDGTKRFRTFEPGFRVVFLRHA